MGLFASIARVFGLTPPIASHEPGGFAISDRGYDRIATLGDATLIIRLSPVPGGYLVHATEGPAKGPVHPDLDVDVSTEDAEHLRGLTLDWDGRWAVRLALRVEGWETPNPDGRMYLVDRPLALGRPRFFAAGAGDAPPLARRLTSIPGVHSVLFRDNAVTVEREGGVAWKALDADVDAAIREHFLSCGQPLPEEAALAHDGFAADVARVLKEQIAPAIHRDGGDIELVDVRDGVVVVHMVGACRSCPASTTTLKLGVEKTLREAFPGRVERVEAL